jgi:hypothetical protein
VPHPLERSHDDLAAHIQDLARWADAFFDDPNYADEDPDTRVEIGQRTTYSAYDDLTFRLRLRARARLPNLSRRLNLVFEGNEDPGVDPGEGRENFETAAEESVDNPTLGLQYFYIMGKRVNVSLSTGLRLGDEGAYVGPRLRYRTALGAGWLGRFTQRLRWYTADGWETDSRADFDRKLGTRNLFRQTVGINWLEDTRLSKGFRVLLGTSFTQPFTDASAMRYAWISTYLTEPFRGWRSTEVSAGYRRRVWRDWVRMEITPFVGWEDGEDWDSNPGLRFTVSFMFENETATQPPHLNAAQR